MQEKGPNGIEKAIKEVNVGNEGAFTTVGFEHEFAGYSSSDMTNKLLDLSHIELAE